MIPNVLYPLVQIYDKKTGKALGAEESFDSKDPQIYELGKTVLIPDNIAVMRELNGSTLTENLALVYVGQLSVQCEEGPILPVDLLELTTL